mmetsp:Transcript_66369/g.131583  ORF Transcript_66369/g.131583 Transcript_66369/m.131583 type:complete len:89 (+) Transcript_66369:85-351(+)
MSPTAGAMCSPTFLVRLTFQMDASTDLATLTEHIACIHISAINYARWDVHRAEGGMCMGWRGTHIHGMQAHHPSALRPPVRRCASPSL